MSTALLTWGPWGYLGVSRHIICCELNKKKLNLKISLLTLSSLSLSSLSVSLFSLSVGSHCQLVLIVSWFSLSWSLLSVLVVVVMVFQAQLGLKVCQNEVLHTSLNTAHSGYKGSSFTSSFTPLHVFLPLPTHFSQPPPHFYRPNPIIPTLMVQMLLHTSLNTAHLGYKGSSFMSSFTPLHVRGMSSCPYTHTSLPATTTYLEAKTQSSPLLWARCPNLFSICHTSLPPPHSECPRD